MIRHIGDIIVFVGIAIICFWGTIAVLKEILIPLIKEEIEEKHWISLGIISGILLLVIGVMVSIIIQ